MGKEGTIHHYILYGDQELALDRGSIPTLDPHHVLDSLERALLCYHARRRSATVGATVENGAERHA